MLKINKNLLLILAKKIMLKFNNIELTQLIKEVNFILKQINFIKNINTNNIKYNFYHRFYLQFNCLHNDDNFKIELQQNILFNAPKIKNGYIIINNKGIK